VPKHHGGAWWVIIIAAARFGFWWIGTTINKASRRPNPTQPGTAAAWGRTAGRTERALIAQQVYTTQWNVVNGDVQLSNQKWVNQSNVTIQSADAECDQYNQAGTDLAQKHIQLTDQVAQWLNR